jgi:hypothetical protein
MAILAGADRLVDESPNQETTLAASEEFDKRSGDYRRSNRLARLISRN